MWRPLKDQNNSLINETIYYIHLLVCEGIFTLEIIQHFVLIIVYKKFFTE